MIGHLDTIPKYLFRTLGMIWFRTPMAKEFQLKRIYEPIENNDGCRMFVDRLWPRGVTRQAAGIDLWPREMAPSLELRRWLHADQSRLEEFLERYQSELNARRAEVEKLLAMISQNQITLVTATKEVVPIHTGVLISFLQLLSS